LNTKAPWQHKKCHWRHSTSQVKLVNGGNSYAVPT
jgi:hypothetical protein